MKSSRAMAMIGLSLAAGIAAVLLAARWVGEQAAQSTRPVAVAARDLEPGTALTEGMLQRTPWPSGTMPAGVFEDPKKLAGRVIRSPVFKGEPVLEPKLAPEGTKGGLTAMIQNGKRAISVKVNEVVGVAGFALPGSYVDVMVHVADSKNKPVSKIVLKRILVLAVAQEANRDETKPKVVSAVTLEVTPAEAETIDLARSIGALSLVLRNAVDNSDTPTSGMDRDDLLGNLSTSAVARVAPAAAPGAVPKRRVAPARAASPIPAGNRVEVIRGVQKANSDF